VNLSVEPDYLPNMKASTENTLIEFKLSNDILRWQCSCRCFVDKHQQDKVDRFHCNTPPDHTGLLPLYTRSLPASTVL